MLPSLRSLCVHGSNGAGHGDEQWGLPVGSSPLEPIHVDLMSMDDNNSLDYDFWSALLKFAKALKTVAFNNFYTDCADILFETLAVYQASSLEALMFYEPNLSGYDGYRQFPPRALNPFSSLRIARVDLEDLISEAYSSHGLAAHKLPLEMRISNHLQVFSQFS
ncbi:hypothetical protein EJ03DRAFT_334851 [Teratosphaeria nubilosa]|uniref:Uncharacterized protein n=1 Tax=Teratosphaeria nubilosa TaxID=161662 RepID=A0A6G1LFE2_9PEZI|nr:hypothetical protein EJ03DRAFT_334851 [Teratosphaeria nubilosa]